MVVERKIKKKPLSKNKKICLRIGLILAVVTCIPFIEIFDIEWGVWNLVAIGGSIIGFGLIGFSALDEDHSFYQTNVIHLDEDKKSNDEDI